MSETQEATTEELRDYRGALLFIAIIHVHRANNVPGQKALQINDEYIKDLRNLLLRQVKYTPIVGDALDIFLKGFVDYQIDHADRREDRAFVEQNIEAISRTVGFRYETTSIMHSFSSGDVSSTSGNQRIKKTKNLIAAYANEPTLGALAWTALTSTLGLTPDLQPNKQ